MCCAPDSVLIKLVVSPASETLSGAHKHVLFALAQVNIRRYNTVCGPGACESQEAAKGRLQNWELQKAPIQSWSRWDTVTLAHQEEGCATLCPWSVGLADMHQASNRRSIFVRWLALCVAD